MLIDCTARYNGSRDLIEVIAVIANDSGTESLHSMIKTASVSLMYNDQKAARSEISFTREAYTKPTDPEDPIGQFKLFFLHFPLQRTLQIAMDVELTDGSTASAIRNVEIIRDIADMSNPVLPFRPKVKYPEIEGIDYKRKP